jgi:hypothetical protein
MHQVSGRLDIFGAYILGAHHLGAHMSSDRSFECNAPDVVFEDFGDEVVVLNLQSGNYYSLDPIGMFYWECLRQGVPPREIAAHICPFYAGGVEEELIAADLDVLFDEFQSEGLIRSSDTYRAISEVASMAKKFPAEYVCPMLSKFDDFAEMLLLDPVHDVSAVGWPHPVPANPAPTNVEDGRERE